MEGTDDTVLGRREGPAHACSRASLEKGLGGPFRGKAGWMGGDWRGAAYSYSLRSTEARMWKHLQPSTAIRTDLPSDMIWQARICVQDNTCPPHPPTKSRDQTSNMELLRRVISPKGLHDVTRELPFLRGKISLLCPLLPGSNSPHSTRLISASKELSEEVITRRKTISLLLDKGSFTFPVHYSSTEYRGVI
jgi:hypothetical protein